MLSLFRSGSPVAALAAAAIAATLSGCGPSRPAVVPVSGTVTIDGQPVEHGSIMVIPLGARPAHGTLGPGGKFTLTTFDEGDGVAAGTHKVTVIANEAQGATGQMWHAPKDYTDPLKSELTLTVDQPTEDAKIELTWSGGKPFLEKFQAE